jgi:hypothetical protein
VRALLEEDDEVIATYLDVFAERAAQAKRDQRRKA